jgi:hypothetical protein
MFEIRGALEGPRTRGPEPATVISISDSTAIQFVTSNIPEPRVRGPSDDGGLLGHDAPIIGLLPSHGSTERA